MHSLTSCCTHEGASQGFAPYQRLPRSRSASSHPDMVPNVDTDPSHYNDLRLDRHKSNSFGHNASSQANQFQHNSETDDYSSTSNHKNVHSHANNFRTKCSSDQVVAVSRVQPSCSRRLHFVSIQQGRSFNEPHHDDANTVLIKIAIIGDSGTGKTSFMAKYGGVELKNDVKDVALLQKFCKLQHVNIALHVWDIGGQWQYSKNISTVCKDAVAIFIMFDLTRRSTLQSVMKWYLWARECNKVAMLVLIGTKYDKFAQMSKELQIAIVQEARAHSKKMKASLFFSSATYNINVHKVFKVVVAKLFDLPCNITQNFKFGEPIVSFQ